MVTTGMILCYSVAVISSNDLGRLVLFCVNRGGTGGGGLVHPKSWMYLGLAVKWPFLLLNVPRKQSSYLVGVRLR